MGAAQSSSSGSSVSQQPHQRAHPRTANTVGDVDVREKQVTALLGNLGMGDDDKPQRDVPRGSGNAQITLDDIGRWQKHYDAAPVRQALATLLRWACDRSRGLKPRSIRTCLNPELTWRS